MKAKNKNQGLQSQIFSSKVIKVDKKIIQFVFKSYIVLKDTIYNKDVIVIIIFLSNNFIKEKIEAILKNRQKHTASRKQLSSSRKLSIISLV